MALGCPFFINPGGNSMNNKKSADFDFSAIAQDCESSDGQTRYIFGAVNKPVADAVNTDAE
jgi:hypothetical protein